MSENPETQNVTAEVTETSENVTPEQKDEVVAETPMKSDNDEQPSDTSEEISQEVQEPVDEPDEISEDEINPIEYFLNALKDVYDKKQEALNELEAKREYLVNNLAQYDTENYFQNDEFKKLYSEVFNKAGVNLDTEKFIGMLDDYVDSRINSHSRKMSAQKENETATDGLGFESGTSKKSQRKLRLQDIPDNQLEYYIAQYI